MASCNLCGQKNDDNAAFCTNCGVALETQPPQPSQPPQTIQQVNGNNAAESQYYAQQQHPYNSENTSGQPYNMPVTPENNDAFNTAPYTPYYNQPYPVPQNNSGKSNATVSLICGILSIVTFATIIGGVVLGIVALLQARTAEKKHCPSKGGMITGIIGLVLSVVILFFIIIGSVFSEDSYNNDSSTAASAQINGTAVPDTVLKGFESYENEDFGLKIQYPMEWMLANDAYAAMQEYLNADMTKEEIVEALAEKLSVDENKAATLFEMLQEIPFENMVVWYDYDHSSEGFVSNININMNDANGVTQNDLKSPKVKQEFQQSLEDVINQIVNDFKCLKEAEGKVLGNNYFVCISYEYSMKDTMVYLYQAATENDGIMYTFTFTIASDVFNAQIPIYEQMLSTLTFNE